MEAPNFDFISKALQGNLIIRKELFDGEVTHDWEELFQDETYFPFRLSLETLLDEYKLEKYFPDFMLIGFIFIENSTKKEVFRLSNLNDKEGELIQALNILLNYSDGFSIDIYRKQIHQITLKNPYWIDVFKDVLFEYLKRRFTSTYESKYLDIEKDWRKFIKYKLSELKENAPKKGRPIQKKFIKPMVYSLWCYIQWYTDLKREEGILYSNKQARFISRFLEILEIIGTDFSNKEDNIGYYLKSHIKSLENRHKKQIPREKKIAELRKEKEEKEEFLNNNQDSISDNWQKSLKKDIENLAKNLAMLEKKSQEV